MPILGTIDSAKTGRLSNPSYDSIASFAGSNNTTISFTSIPSTYKHLELRVVARTNATGGGAIDAFMTFNSVSSNYNWHELTGYANTTENVGSGINTTQIQFIRNALPRASEVGYGMAVVTILDYRSSEYKGVLSRCGYVSSNTNTGGVSEISASSTITSAITRIDLTIEGGATWTTDSWFELYGIKG